MEKNRRKFPWLPVAGMAVLACALGLFWLSQNPTSVAQWALKKAMPQAGIAVDAVRFGEPGEIIFENFVLPDPITGKPLLRLERGRLVFTFSDILRRRIGEIHLVNPLLVISPGWSGVFPKTAAESKSAPAPTIRRVFCDFGEVRYEGSSTGRPDISAKFCMDWKEISVHSEGLQNFTLWDIQATAPGFQNPFLVLDLIRLQATPQELFERFEIRESKISGGALAIGSALDQLTHLPKNPAQNPTPTWRLGLLEISGVRASLGENAWRAESDITFTIATTLQNLTPSEITNKLGATEQSIELSNLAIPSPRDPFTHVLKLRSVLIQFTLAGLLDQEIRGVTLTSPVVSIGEDLFLYMDQARSRRGGGAATDSAAWKIQRLEVKSGSLVIGSGGRDNYGLPQKFQSERLYINTILKLSYYFHALSRFDKPAEERKKDNLLILFADEGQEIITGAESAFADHRAAGVIREAKATIVLATQAYTSLLGSLDKRYADVLMLNLSNELIFTVANHDSAVIAAKNIGEHEVTEKSWGWASGKRSYNYQTRIKPWFEPYLLRKLPRFKAIVCHCEKPFRKRLLPPITPEGYYPEWFTSLRPDYALRQWWRGKPQALSHS